MNPVSSSRSPQPGLPPVVPTGAFAPNRSFALLSLALVAVSTLAVALASHAAESPASTQTPAVPLPGGTNLVYPAPLPFPAPGVEFPIFRVLLALAMVLGLLAGGAWLVRRAPHLLGPRGASPRLRVLEVRALGGKHALFVVGYDQQRLLVGSSPNGLNLIDRLPPEDSPGPEAPTMPGGTATSFRAALGQLLSQR